MKRGIIRPENDVMSLFSGKTKKKNDIATLGGAGKTTNTVLEETQNYSAAFFDFCTCSLRAPDELEHRIA